MTEEKNESNLLSDAQPLSAEAARSRAAARIATRRAVTNLQASVLAALDGAALAGLPNLGTSRDKYNAINVRASDPAKKFDRGPEARPTLVIYRTGELQLVQFTNEEITYEAADLDTLTENDLVPIARGYRTALALHGARLASTMERSEALVSLADAIDLALKNAPSQ